jgi:hypothetical protein
VITNKIALQQNPKALFPEVVEKSPKWDINKGDNLKSGEAAF